MKRHCFALDLADDPALIAEYKRHHQQIWPEIKESLLTAGIVDMEIYLLGTRLFMIMEVDDTYSPEAKRQADMANPKVQEWERLMWRFQRPLPMARAGEKWIAMERIFSLAEQR